MITMMEQIASILNKYSACDLFSLQCGVLTGEIILNSTCLDTKSYIKDNTTDGVFVYISSDASLGFILMKSDRQDKL